LGALAVAGLLLAIPAFGHPTPKPGVTPVASGACGPLEYGGTGKPNALIVSDLPLQGDSRRRSLQMNEAIRIVLTNSHWLAGKHRVAFQACDDSVASTGLWSAARCRANAQAYAADHSVLAVIGTYNSGCAAVMIPILGQAPGGGIAMVSPGNTLVCLTESSPSCTGGEPDSLYPKGRNYARVVPNDAYQGAGLARFARSRHRKRVYILYAAKDLTSLGQARNFRGAAKHLGIKVVGFRAWNANASSYKRLMHRVRAASPDAVMLAGLIEENGAKLIKAKVAAMGSNRGRVMLMAFDGFAQQSTISLTGAAAHGMFASVPGRVPQALTGPGKQLVSQLKAQVHGSVELYAPYAGQAAAVVLTALSTANSRSGVITGVFQTRITNGIIGSFRILSTGDPSVGVITLSVAKHTFRAVRAFRPSQALVAAARTG
jgi:branched-chain amino acid transport system substrate-binding protein